MKGRLIEVAQAQHFYECWMANAMRPHVSEFLVQRKAKHLQLLAHMQLGSRVDNPVRSRRACGQSRVMIRSVAAIIHSVSLAEMEKTLNPCWQLAWFSLHMPNPSLQILNDGN